MQDPGKEESVFLASFPKPDPQFISKETENRWNDILKIREMVFAKLEEAKNAGVINKPIEARITLHLDKSKMDILPKDATELAGYFIVSQVELAEGDEACFVEKATGEKCQRCWLILKETGCDEKHPGLCPRCAKALE